MIRDKHEVSKLDAPGQLNVRQLRNRAMSSSQIPSRTSSVPLDRLSGEDEIHDLGFLTPTANGTDVRLTLSLEIDTDEGKGIRC